jgi:hypothetical protein
MSEPSQDIEDASPGSFENAELFQTVQNERTITTQVPETFHNALSRLETVVQHLVTRAAQPYQADFEKYLLLLRLWATDVNVEGGSLAILQSYYPEEAQHVQSYLQQIISALSPINAQNDDALLLWY